MIAQICIALLALNAAAWHQPNPTEPTNGASIVSILPVELQERIPSYIRNEIQSFSVKDILVLNDVIEQLPKFTSLNHIRQSLKDRNPHLESILQQKALKIMGWISLKRAQLIPKSQSALKEAEESTKNYVRSMIQLIKHQSPEVKSNFDQTFPELTFYLNSPMFNRFAEYLQRI